VIELLSPADLCDAQVTLAQNEQPSSPGDLSDPAASAQVSTKNEC